MTDDEKLAAYDRAIRDMEALDLPPLPSGCERWPAYVPPTPEEMLARIGRAGGDPREWEAAVREVDAAQREHGHHNTGERQ